jgi:hypothetical protein
LSAAGGTRNATRRVVRVAGFPTTAKRSMPRAEYAMGRFDNRNTTKMGRKKRQAKKKARIKRKAAAVKASRTKKPSSKKK